MRWKRVPVFFHLLLLYEDICIFGSQAVAAAIDFWVYEGRSQRAGACLGFAAPLRVLWIHRGVQKLKGHSRSWWALSWLLRKFRIGCENYSRSEAGIGRSPPFFAVNDSEAVQMSNRWLESSCGSSTSRYALLSAVAVARRRGGGFSGFSGSSLRVTNLLSPYSILYGCASHFS